MSTSDISAQELGIPKLKELMDKNFWTRPEGRFGKVLLGLLGVALAAGLFVSLPAILAYLLVVVQTTTQIVLNLAFLTAAYYIVTNRWIHALVGSWFRATVRSIVGFFVDMAPVAVARDYFTQAKKHLQRGFDAVKRFKARMANTLSIITEFEKTAERHEAAAKQFTRRGDMEQARAFQVRYERTVERIKKLREIYGKMELVSRTLEAMLKKTRMKIENAEQEMDDQIRMYEAMVEARSAVREVKESIGAGSTQEEMKNMAAAKMALEVAEAVVEIDDLMSMSEELFSSVDAENAVYDERALAKLRKWEQEAESSILAPGEKQALIHAAGDPNNQYDLEASATVAEVRRGFNPNDFFSK